MPASLVPMKIWRLQNLYALIKLDQLDKSLYNYTHEFNSSLSFWKDDISIKAAAYTYIAGLKVGALRADLMTNWQASNYSSLLALQNDDAKNSLWRSTAGISPSSGSFCTTQNKGMAPMPTPSYKRPHGSVGQSSRDNHGNFEGNGSKDASGNRGTWGHPKDAKAGCKSPSKSQISDKKVKHNGGACGSKSYDS